MGYLWRHLTGRCPWCGQKLKPRPVSHLNNRANHLAKSLGRWPRFQGCKKCHKIVFEGQSGFKETYLLIDMEQEYSLESSIGQKLAAGSNQT